MAQPTDADHARTAPDTGILVVKCGGNAAVGAHAVCADVAALVRAGRRVVLMHGGSADIDRLTGRLGLTVRRMVSPDGAATRFTDEAALEVALLALAGAVKPRLVAAHRAIVDGRTVVVRDDRSGRIAALGARTLVLLTGAPGVLSDPQREDSLVNVCILPDTGLPSFAVGGRALKLVAAREALTGGVPIVLISDGRAAQPVHTALAGAGTQIELIHPHPYQHQHLHTHAICTDAPVAEGTR